MTTPHPCPFCGHQPFGIGSDRDPVTPLYRVTCRCGAMGPVSESADGAAELWAQAAKSSGDRAPELQTPANLLRCIYQCTEAARRISLGQLPESTEGMNAHGMAQLLCDTIAAGQMAPHQPINPVLSAESETWGTADEGVAK